MPTGPQALNVRTFFFLAITKGFCCVLLLLLAGMTSRISLCVTVAEEAS